MPRLWRLIIHTASAIGHTVHNLEYEPRSQWHFHLRMSWWWVANFPIITVLYFVFPREWIAIGLLLNTYYSLYANFDTEFDGVHSSYAAMKGNEITATLNQEGQP